MRKCLVLFSSLLIINLLGFLFFVWNSTPARAGVSISASITICGNGTVEGAEECDGSNLNNTTCVSLGFTGGTLTCNSNCTRNTSACTSGPVNGGGGGGGGGAFIPPATAVVLQGKAYPVASINVLYDGQVATIIQADSQANFKVTLTTLSAGTYTFGLWAEDKEGRRSITFSFTITVTQGMTTTVSNIFLPPTIELEKVNLLRGEDLKVMGQTAPESEVTLYVESPDAITKKTEADKEGDWDYAFNTSPLAEGSHTARAKAETTAGLLSSFSKVLGFFIGKYGTAEICPRANFNKDGKTNLIDFSIMLYWWGKYNPCVDQNQNGIVDLADFSILMYWWTG